MIGVEVEKSYLSDVYTIDNLIGLQDFGMTSYTPMELCWLLATDMFFSGEIDIELPDSWYEKSSVKYAIFIEKLEPEVKKLFDSSRKAIEQGRLRCERIRSDLNGNLLTDLCLIDIAAFKEWIEASGIETGDFIYDFMLDESEIFHDVAELILQARLNVKLKIDSARPHLTEDKPIHKRTKNNYLKVIGALRKELIDQHGVAEKVIASIIVQNSELLDATVASSTAYAILAEIEKS